MDPVANKLSLNRTTLAFFLGLGIGFSSIPAQATVAQVPLLLGGGNVPGNLALVPSVEYPTVISVANTGSYSSSTKYVGYFNSNKCYIYDQSNQWFEPNSDATNHTCSGSKRWSGNFLNWAATPTIDPFRSALTGGYRVVDTTTATVLQKARHAGEDTFGNRMNSSQGVIAKADITGATPATSSWDNFYIRLQGQGSDMLFSNWNDGIGGGGSTGEKTDEWVNYEPNTPAQWDNNRLRTGYTPAGSNQVRSIYRVKIRVKVCDPTKGLETNCERYPNGSYKPVGLLQQYSGTLRYSVFGYLNDIDMLRDGGVLRAQQKSISPEWNANTGVMVQNPDNITSALGRPISNSGVMNYLNKFGELNTETHKSHDPVSELFYTALRYFKNQGNVAAYSTATPAHNTSPSNSVLDRWHDGFPVINTWNDPIQYACQKNVILGIGDTNTHRDKNLPGNTATTNEPAVPGEVTADTTINVVTATNKVAELEGLTISTPFTGRENSAYIAGLAYDANTKDLRPNMAGKQTVSTYWVDVQEGQVLQAKASNQYWLAAKYGGFKVPSNFGDPYTRTAALEQSWWRTTADNLSTGNPRPDNFFVASDATKMVEGLKKAFAQISQEVSGTTASLATNSTRLATDTAVFQSLLDNRYWSGDLMAKTVANNGTVSSTASWSAATKLNSATPSGRKIFTPRPLTTQTDGTLSTSASNFTWNDLNEVQKALLQTAAEITANDSATAQNRLDYLRGERSQEKTNDDLTKPFRQRGSRLGDIVNSDPQYTHKEDYGYSGLIGNSWTSARAAYATFVTGKSSRTPMVVVGANDGMLHGFNASVETNGNGGQELFGFIPNSVFANLKDLADPAYSHKYYVDGTPRISDVWNGSAWLTLLAGTTGSGGKSVFALDISSAANMGPTKFLWEFSHPDMGYTIGQPSIVALPNGEFGVVVTSGYHDTAKTTGKIWFLNATTGAIIHTITLNNTGNLAAPLLADTNGDQVADRLYVGDSVGKLWRIDLSGSTASSWGIPTSLSSGPLFVATKDGTAQPITVQPSSAFNEKGEHMVFFGTGSFVMTGDNEVPANPPVQSFYGIIDKGLSVARSDLLQQSILKEVNINDVKGRAISQNTMGANQKGWYLDLAWTTGTGATGALGERVISKATLRSDRVNFTTMTPSSDPCASGGTSWIMALNLSSGARLNYVYFDTNRDGDLNSSDSLVEGGNEIPLSGISDPDDGVVKGAAPLYRWLCYAGSAGAAPQCIRVAGSQRYGRHSWQEIR